MGVGGGGGYPFLTLKKANKQRMWPWRLGAYFSPIAIVRQRAVIPCKLFQTIFEGHLWRRGRLWQNRVGRVDGSGFVVSHV